MRRGTDKTLYITHRTVQGLRGSNCTRDMANIGFVSTSVLESKDGVRFL